VCGLTNRIRLYVCDTASYSNKNLSRFAQNDFGIQQCYVKFCAVVIKIFFATKDDRIKVCQRI